MTTEKLSDEIKDIKFYGIGWTLHREYITQRIGALEQELKNTLVDDEKTINLLISENQSLKEVIEALDELYAIQCKWYDFMYDCLQKQKAEVKRLTERLAEAQKNWSAESYRQMSIKVKLAESRLEVAEAEVETFKRQLKRLEEFCEEVMMKSHDRRMELMKIQKILDEPFFYASQEEGLKKIGDKIEAIRRALGEDDSDPTKPDKSILKVLGPRGDE